MTTISDSTHPSGDDRFAVIDKRLKRVQHAQDQLIEVLHVAQDVFGQFWNAGQTYYFQYFSRDNQAGPSPCGGFANLSSAYAVTMSP